MIDYYNTCDDFLLLLLEHCGSCPPAVKFKALSCVTPRLATRGPQCAVQQVSLTILGKGEGRGGEGQEGGTDTKICLLTCVSTSNIIRNNKTSFEKVFCGFFFLYLMCPGCKRKEKLADAGDSFHKK